MGHANFHVLHRVKPGHISGRVSQWTRGAARGPIRSQEGTRRVCEFETPEYKTPLGDGFPSQVATTAPPKGTTGDHHSVGAPNAGIELVGHQPSAEGRRKSTMFASMQKPQAAAKRPAEDEKEEATGWRSATALALSQDSRFGQWKRLKTDESEASATSSTQSQKPMLGAWFGARSSQLGMTQANPFARTKQEEQEDSEDDKPLAKVVSREVKPGQRQTQKQAARTQSKQASANATQARSGITSARNVAANAERVSSNEDERVFHLSSKRRVTVRKWKSAVLVDIREYYDDNGVSKPGKKGISLAKDQWSTLLRLSRVIDEAIALVEEDSVDPHSLENVKERGAVSSEERSIAFTLSSKRRITVRFFRTAVLVDIREYYEQGSEMKPGKKGISLSKDQWRGLHKIEPEISEAIQEL